MPCQQLIARFRSMARGFFYVGRQLHRLAPCAKLIPLAYRACPKTRASGMSGALAPRGNPAHLQLFSSLLLCGLGIRLA